MYKVGNEYFNLFKEIRGILKISDKFLKIGLK